MSHYAENTSVPVEKSRAEIEGTLQRYGATAFSYAWNADKAMIQFQSHDRVIRFVLPLPDPKSDDFKWSKHRQKYNRIKLTDEAARRNWEQACRQRWRALALAIKAKLEAVTCGISEFENEFLAHIVDPATGRTVGEIIRPQIAVSYDSGADPQQLLLGVKDA